MKVISIDPAPAKEGVIFDGECWTPREPDKLVEYCEGLGSSKDGVLLCWDAPLTGWHEQQPSFSQRKIEKFFSRKEFFKTEKGISVQPYSGCSHWAISQGCLGLPKIGKYHSGVEPPFKLLHTAEQISGEKPMVVETHPALALWVWWKKNGLENDGFNGSGANEKWSYKGSKSEEDSIQKIWEKLLIFEDTAKFANRAIRCPENDDELDAFVGWILGMMLVEKSDEVEIVGDEAGGAIVLPKFEIKEAENKTLRELYFEKTSG